MWNSLKPEFLARLPHSPTNGSANGPQGPAVVAPPPTNWESCFEKLNEYRSYTDDWDGQGEILGKPAKAIPGELIDSAVALMRSLRQLSVPAPHCTYPGVQGTVSVEWELTGGRTVTLEVIDPGTADVFFFAPDNKVEHLVLTEAVTA